MAIILSALFSLALSEIKLSSLQVDGRNLKFEKPKVMGEKKEINYRVPHKFFLEAPATSEMKINSFNKNLSPAAQETFSKRDRLGGSELIYQ